MKDLDREENMIDDEFPLPSLLATGAIVFLATLLMLGGAAALLWWLETRLRIFS